MSRLDGRQAAGDRMLVGLAAALGVMGLAACGKGEKSAAAGAESAASAAPAAAPAADPSAAGQPHGAQLFQRCAVCHQSTGLGVPGSFPPLKGSEWATAANPDIAIRVVLHGLQGQLTVADKQFNSAMPAYGTGQVMSDAEVAAVLTYVRSSWGNQASAVTPEEVARVRAATSSRTTPWTQADLAPLLKSGH
jgi:mono/diheme cytochrome c family protein